MALTHANSESAVTPMGPVRQIQAGVLDVGYVDAGPRDGPAVVLLHGWPYDIHTFAEVWPLLAAAGHRVIVPYLRGYGTTRFLSDETPRNGQQSVLAVDAVALLDALGIEKAVVAGADWGARTAGVLAALWPERCAGLVSVSGYLIGNQQLKADGFNVSVVQNQTLSLESDVETTHNVLDQQDGAAILVGHSYGGVVITEAGMHDKVAGLVYISAFAPDAGESVNALIADPPPGAPVPPILPPQDGFLFLDRDKFADSFAADVPAGLAAFMADSQVPWGLEALNGTVSEPAWHNKPSWYLVASDDRMIPPPAQRFMSERAGSTVTEAAGSHSVYVSQPRATADLIEQAARETSVESAAA